MDLSSHAILCPQYKEKDKIERTTEITNERNKILIFILKYLLTAIGLTPGGSTHLHKNNTKDNIINNFGRKASWDSNPEWSN
jgi:hypothetical protein